MKRNPTGEVRQVDIARRLGVSQRAVAYALSDQPAHRAMVSRATRERILETARACGYRPHRFARLLRGGKSGLIGVVSAVSYLEVGVARQFAAANAIHTHGFEIFTSEVWWGEEKLRRAVDAMLGARVEGVLLVGIGPVPGEDELRRLVRAGLPVVSAGGDPVPFAPSVSQDYGQGMVDLTRHVLALGHRRLAYLTPFHKDKIPLWPTINARLRGFVETAASAGLAEPEATVVYGSSETRLMDLYQPGKRGMQTILTQRKRPTVVLCSNDYMAVGALAACAEAGVRVPDDIALTGFDNTILGEYLSPPLTSVAQPTEDVAVKAVEILVNMIRNGTTKVNPRTQVLPCRLVVRQSCGAGPKRG
jgi:LacI family transcriptional regulator